MITEKKDTKPVEEITIADIVENEEDKKILEPVKSKKINKTRVGIVIPNSLFVRKEIDPNSEIVLFLKKGDAVVIDENGTTDEFYHITAECAIGYVPVDSIEVK